MFVAMGLCGHVSRSRVEGEVVKLSVFASVSSPVETGAVIPVALHFAVSTDQRVDAGGTWPVTWTEDEVLLAALFEDVAKSLDLGVLVIGDADGAIPPRPDLVAPVVQPADLASEVALQRAHELGEVLGF